MRKGARQARVDGKTVRNYYDILGVGRDASDEAIRGKFRVLARDAHPDRFTDPAKKAEAEARFQVLTEAVNVLTNAQRRKAHDFDLDKGTGGAAFEQRSDDHHAIFFRECAEALRARAGD